MADNPLTPVTSGVTGVLRRIFGPASTELGELLADRVRAYQARNLNCVLAEAKDNMYGVVEELPLRFSIPFMEKASLEDDGDLTGMWSQLLVDAASGIDDDHYLYLSILSNLTPTAAGLLKYIVDEFYKSEDWYDELGWEDDFLQDVERYVREEVENRLSSWSDPDGGEKIADLLIQHKCKKPFWVYRVELPAVWDDLKREVDGGRDLDSLGTVSMTFSVESPSLHILEREGLMVRREHDFNLTYCKFKFMYVAATPAAVGLMRTCAKNDKK